MLGALVGAGLVHAEEPQPPEALVFVMIGQSNMEGYSYDAPVEDYVNLFPEYWPTQVEEGPNALDATQVKLMYSLASFGLTTPFPKPGSDSGQNFIPLKDDPFDWETNFPTNSYPHRYGPEIALGLALENANPDKRIFIVKIAAGSQAMTYWDPDFPTPHFGAQRSLSAVQAAKGRLDALVLAGEISGYSVEALMWMQGEGDAFETDPGGRIWWERGLRGMHRSIAQVMGGPADSMALIVGRIRDGQQSVRQPGVAANYPRAAPLQAIRQIQSLVGLGEDGIRKVVIDTDDMEVWPGDRIHYSALGLFELGVGFFDAWQSLQHARPVILSEELASGVVGESYAQQLNGTSSAGLLAWELFGGEKDALPASDLLPDGLELATDGSISGTPAEAGTFSFFVSATDENGIVRLKTLHLVVAEAAQDWDVVPPSAMSTVVRDDTVGAKITNVPPDRGPATDKLFPVQSVNFVSTDAAPGAVETWIQFPLNSLNAANIGQAKLRLYVLDLAINANGQPVTAVNFTLGTAGDQNWNESTLTWESRVSGTMIASSSVNGAGWVEWDVTDYLRSHVGAVAGFSVSADVQGEVRIAGKSSPLGAPVLLVQTVENPQLSAPTITRQPVPRTVLVAERASFEVWGSGNPTPLYQWQVSTDNGVTFVDLPGANSATLALEPAAIEQSGNLYQVVITNSGGTVTSDRVALTVLLAPPPAITQQPQSATSYVNGFVAFSVVANGFGELTYQWFRDDMEIQGAISAGISFTGLTLEDDGSVFYVKITDELDQTTDSELAVLTIEAAPEEIVLRPNADKSSLSDESGTNIGLNISGSGPPPDNDRLLAAHAFIRFDAAVFDGRVIEEAKLKFHFNKNDQSLRIWRVDIDWTESTPGADLVDLANLDYAAPQLLVPVTAGINEVDVTALLPSDVTSASQFTFVLIRERLSDEWDSIQSRDAALPPELYLRFEVPLTFDRWMASLPEPPPEGLRGLLDDPAGSGITNLLSYALGRDPMSVDRALLPLVSMVQEAEQTFLAVTYRRRVEGVGDAVSGYIANGVEYLVETNHGLASADWVSGPTALLAVGDPVPAEEGFETVTVRSLTPMEGNEAEFIRLLVRDVGDEL